MTSGRKASHGRKKKGSVAVVLLAVLAILLFVSGGMLAYGYAQELKRVEEMQLVVQVDTVYPGISVGGIDISGMTEQQAEDHIMDIVAKKMESYVVSISVDSRTWPGSLPSSNNAQQALDLALQYARTGDLESRYNAITALREAPKDFALEYKVDPSLLPMLIDTIGEELDYDAIDATVVDFDRESKAFIVTDEVEGRRLDREGLRSALSLAVEAGEYPIHLTGTLHVVAPQATKEQLSGRNKLLSTFTTTAATDSKRNSNIRLACDSFNGSLVMPDEIFSLNEKTGLRSTAKGYQDAGAIKNGKLVPEPGGGVCQVSTTLFNAIVRSGVEIVERNNHSYPISYVPRGMDAMINYPGQDFKFKNTTNSPMYILTSFVDQKLTIEVYGEPLLSEGEHIDLRAETTATLSPGATDYIYDSSLYAGVEQEERAARTGYRVTTYIQRYKGEEMVEEKELFKSYYVPYSRQVRVGTMQGGFTPIPEL